MNITELKNIALKEFDFKDISFERIQKIMIVPPNSNFRGKIIPHYITGKLIFDLLLDKNATTNLSSNDINSRNESLAIIFHELYHYKEALITSKNIDYHKLIFDDNYSDTYTMVLSIGYKQWTEYYAYYNSAKYQIRNILFDNCVLQSWTSLQAMHNMLLDTETIQMPFSFYENIKHFISNAIMFTAQYNYLANSQYLTSICKYKNNKDYSKHYEYIIELIPYLRNLYNSYPNWISEAKFIEIGKYLLNILHRFNIEFSTKDLSDNFVYKKFE